MERELEVFRAKLAEEVDRYDDVVDSMKKVCKINADLSLEEMNLLLAGYKNSLMRHRTSRRIIKDIELDEEQGKGKTNILKKLKELRLKVEAEQENISKDCINLIDTYLIHSSISTEAIVFYNKMKGDHYRYLAEIKVGDERQSFADQSLAAYEAAWAIAVSELPATHPVRLSLALNYSVFFYDIHNDVKMAHKMARDAYDLVMPELNNLSSEIAYDSMLSFELLKDNIDSWSEELPNGSVNL